MWSGCLGYVPPLPHARPNVDSIIARTVERNGQDPEPKNVGDTPKNVRRWSDREEPFIRGP